MANKNYISPKADIIIVESSAVLCESRYVSESKAKLPMCDENCANWHWCLDRDKGLTCVDKYTSRKRS